MLLRLCLYLSLCQFHEYLINFIKKSLVKKKIKDGIKASKEVEALKEVRILLLLTLDFYIKPWPVSLF